MEEEEETDEEVEEASLGGRCSLALKNGANAAGRRSRKLHLKSQARAADLTTA